MKCAPRSLSAKPAGGLLNRVRDANAGGEHGDQRNGGLGDAIANLLVHKLPVPMEYVGVKDSFGESGKPVELLEKYGMSKKDVLWAVKDVLDRKK